MGTIGKQIIDRFFKGEDSLENLCYYAYTYYGIGPFASWFAKEKRSEFFQSNLWGIFDSPNKEKVAIGAFLLLAETVEEHPPVPVEFAQRALNVWSQRKFEDEKVLAYAFNRFPYSRKSS